MSFCALRSSSGDPYLNLALEEALLEAPGTPPFVFLLYSNDPCIVIGRNQNPWAEASAGAELPLLRRVSGGGAVYQDRGNLNWALFLPRSRHDPDAEIDLVARSLAALGVAARRGKRGGLFLDGGPLDGRKISGTARRMSADRVLHHGTLLVEADLDRLERSLEGIEVSSSRSLASVPALPANLSELIPGLGLDSVASALLRGLSSSASFEDAEVAVRGLVAPGKIESFSERLASWEWTYGQTLPFAVEGRTPAGPLLIEVREGLVAGLGGEGVEFLSATERSSLLGSRFDSHLMEKYTPLS